MPHQATVLIRVTPGAGAPAHRAVTTGVEDQQFGLSIASGAATDVARLILRQPALELAGVPCTGAYHHAMASNDNQLPRPPVIAVREGQAWPLIRRETQEDMLRRDVG